MLERAISVTLSEEQEIKSKLEMHKYQILNNSSSRLCFNCNKPGHTKINCRFRKTANLVPQNNIRHFSQNNRKFCRYCKEPGHILEESREREYNNR